MVQEWVQHILQELVTRPADIIIVRTTDNLGVLLTITSHPTDAGLVIGREGSTLKAIRILARLLGAKTQERINIVYQDPKGEFKK